MPTLSIRSHASLSRRVAVVSAAAGIATFATGCVWSGPKAEADANKIRNNPTPELSTLYERPADVRNGLALQHNANFRMARQDMGRFWLLDRPSRLTPEPVPE